MQSGSKYTRSLLENYGDKLSDFVQQNGVSLDFDTAESWVILSSIELSIKKKIESVGVPLKDWDISIYRGVLTGYNEAFIISTEKRNEILGNCQSDEERERTAELIRPILRGRDIKRYGYDWAGLYLIATFPSRHYDIEQYPAVKQHLLSFGMERLEQTGKEYVINGVKIKARKKTNNKWFETQDSISYWDDFNMPKLVWGEISDRSKFAFDVDGKYVPEATTFLLVGKNVISLYSFLNSSPAEWYFSKLGPRTGEGTIRWKKYTVEQIFAPKLSETQAANLFLILSSNKDKATITNHWFYNFYKFSNEEIEYIEDYFQALIKNK